MFSSSIVLSSLVDDEITGIARVIDGNIKLLKFPYSTTLKIGIVIANNESNR